MAKYLLPRCPNCDAAMHFPAMPSIEYVIEGLLKESGGKCPLCGEQVVVDEPSPAKPPFNPCPNGATIDAIRSVSIVDLPLTIGCRRELTKLDATTLGDILDLGRDTVLAGIGESSEYAEDLCKLIADKNLTW